MSSYANQKSREIMSKGGVLAALTTMKSSMETLAPSPPPANTATSTTTSPSMTSTTPLATTAATATSSSKSTPTASNTTASVAAARSAPTAIKTANTTTTPSSLSLAGQKRTTSSLSSTTSRPRSKRSKQPDNRSTITTTTASAATVNVYDAVLGEAQDLLSAAQEAQALGRLKMAAAYQLLLHARLVGLGKRFDRARIQQSQSSTTESASKTGEAAALSGPSTKPAVATTPATKTAATTSTSKGGKKKSNKASPSSSLDPMQALANHLPPNIELDAVMMEHLARAAMELHHQRTGRKIQSDLELQQQKEKAAAAQAEFVKNASTTTNVKSTGKPLKLQWTKAEMIKVKQLSKAKATEEAIFKAIPTKAPEQIRAYLRNLKSKTKSTALMEAEMMASMTTPTVVAASVADEEITPTRKKGRGRKPPTTAMNTVPNAKIDIRKLLRGEGLDDVK